MKLVFLILILLSLSTLSLLVVVGLWRHKRAISADIKLMGERAEVSTTLEPDGAVLVQGELWCARSSGGILPVGTQVRVVAIRGHVLIVETSVQSR